MKLEERMASQLAQLRRAGNHRMLKELRHEGAYLVHKGARYLNLSSNDYLGLSHSAFAQHEFVAKDGEFLHGSPSARLITGNVEAYEELESEIRALFPGKDALVLNCGYMANCGILAAVCEKDDLILADKLVHASLIDGLKLSSTPWRRFAHNDLAHLEKLLSVECREGRNVWVLIESIYSMDGDVAPLAAIIELKQRYDFYLMVDEAHSFGLRGPQGQGLCAELDCIGQVDVIMATFGKAIAGAGAMLVCSPLMRDYLVNRMRSFIFTSALPPITLKWNAMILREMRTEAMAMAFPDIYPRMSQLRAHLKAMIEEFNTKLALQSPSQIIPLQAGSNERALSMAKQGLDAGYWLCAIRPPTVPQGAARIRLSLHAGLSYQQIQELILLCKKLG